MFRISCTRKKTHWLGNSGDKRSATAAPGRRHRASFGVELLESRITPSKLAILPAQLPNLGMGQECDVAMSATIGGTHDRYRLASGELPVGLSLSKFGVLAGEAMASGTYRFAIQVMKPGHGGKGNLRWFSMTVSPTLALRRHRRRRQAKCHG